MLLNLQGLIYSKPEIIGFGIEKLNLIIYFTQEQSLSGEEAGKHWNNLR